MNKQHPKMYYLQYFTVRYGANRHVPSGTKSQQNKQKTKKKLHELTKSFKNQKYRYSIHEDNGISLSSDMLTWIDI